MAFADDLLQICYRGKSVFSSSVWGGCERTPYTPPGYGPVTVFVVAPWLPLLRILNTSLSVNFMFLPEKEKARRKSKIEKKMMRGSLEEYQILRTRTSSRNLQ